MKKFLFEKPNVKYSLGLDLGITSVGWSVMARKSDPANLHKLPIYSLHDFGVHLFTVPADLKKGISTAEQRRKFRGSRRLIRRRAQRIQRMQNMLKNSGFDFSVDAKSNLKETNQILIVQDKKVEFAVKDGFKNIYLLKYKAIKEKITPEELYLILLHSCKKRGYKNKFDEAEKTKGFTGIIAKTKELTKNHTISEAILKNKQFRIVDKKNEFLLYVHNGKLMTKDVNLIEKVNYRWIFSRDALEEELIKILDFQTKTQTNDFFWKKIKENKKKLIENVIQQRDFEMGGKCRECQKRIQGNQCQNYQSCSRYKTFLDLTGKCIFYPEEFRGFKSSLLFIAWHFALEISKVFSALSKEKIKFSSEFYQEIIEKFMKENLNKTDLKKILKNEISNKIHIWTDGVSFEANYLKKIHEFPQLRKYIEKINFKKNPIEQLSDVNNPINKIGKLMVENKTPDRLKKELQNIFEKHKISFSEKELNHLISNTNKFATRTKVSFFRMKDQLQKYFVGDPKLQSEEIEYGKFSFQKTENDKHRAFAPLRDIDMEKNPVVFQAINETRKVLKALNNWYGEFDSITIEVGSEIAKSLDQRSVEEKKNKDNQKNNIEIEGFLKENNINTNSKNILKYSLWKQQQGQCLYCGAQIELAHLDSFSFQIDHIVPQSVWGDDSAKNKTLTCTGCNAEKGNNLPLQYLTEKMATDFKKRVEQCYKSTKKGKIPSSFRMSYFKKKYLLLEKTDDEIFEKFISKCLNDTRYIGKWFSSYVRKQIDLLNYKTNVLVVPGAITSFLRRRWLISSPWGLDQKVRDITPFHHAVDAIILSQIRNQTFIELILDINSLNNAMKKIEKTHGDYRELKEIELKDLKVKIIKKWNKNNEKYENKFKEHILLLENWIKNSQAFSSIFISDLKNNIEKRIPIKLTKKEEIDKKGRFFPEFHSLLNEEEWNKEVKEINFGEEINLRFPYISRRIKYKLPKDFVALENFGFIGGDALIKSKIFHAWKKNNKIIDSKLKKFFREICAENITRKELKKSPVDWTQWESIFIQNKQLKEKIKKTIIEKKSEKNDLQCSKNLIWPLILLIMKKKERKIKNNLKKWIEEFTEQKAFDVKNNSIISLETYYGFFINSLNKKANWITKYQAQKIFKDKEPKKYQEFNYINFKKNLFVPNVLFQHHDAKLKKQIIKNYLCKGGNNIKIFPNSLFTNNQCIKNFIKIIPANININTFPKTEITMLKIDILGNKLSSVKIDINDKSK